MKIIFFHAADGFFYDQERIIKRKVVFFQHQFHLIDRAGDRSSPVQLIPLEEKDFKNRALETFLQEILSGLTQEFQDLHGTVQAKDLGDVL